MPRCDKQIKAAIFDIGATLVTGPPVAPNKVLASIIPNATHSEIGSIIMNNDLKSAAHACEVLTERFGRLDKKSTELVFGLWESQSIAPIEIEGATETVSALKYSGLKIALLSDIWNPYYLGVERALPTVIEIADVITLSCRSGYRKPDKHNFKITLDKLGLLPEETVMIGDTYTHDIQPALELGMKAVWVLARPDRESEFVIKVLNGECPTPTATVGSIKDITSLNLWANLSA